jgi:RNA polymerase sigma-70 factor (ECF subfamily)
VTACRDIEPLLAERASGDLAPGDEARVEAHLVGCPRCRDELAAYSQALDLARMPADGTYGSALAGLDASTLVAWKGRCRRRATAFALGGGLAAAAAAAVLALSPAYFHRGQRSTAVPAVASAWEPDVDSALAAAGVLDTEGWYTASAYYGSSDDSAEDVVLAAFDEAVQ